MVRVQETILDKFERKHVVAVIEKNVYLDSSLVKPEVGPREKGQTERYRRRVEREQLVLEPEPGLVYVSQLARCSELARKVPEKILKEFTWAVFVGMRERRFVRVPVYTKMYEFSVATL